MEFPARPAPTQNAPLRFGVICPGTILSAWQAQCIRRLLIANVARPALLLVQKNAGPTQAGKATGSTQPPRSLWSLYRQCMRVPAERPVSLEADLAGVPALCIESAPGLRVSEAVLEQIGALHLDFILHFGVGLVEEALLRAARYGVWFYLHGQAPSFGSAAPGYAEICAGEPVTMASLRRWVAPECSIVLREGCFKALHHAYARGLNALLAGSACWPAQVCTDILNGNADYLEDAPPAPNPPIRPSPGNLQTVGFLLRQAKSAGAWLWSHLRPGQWNIGIVEAPIQAFLTPGAKPAVRWLAPPAASEFVADPFALYDGKSLSLLCEQFRYAASRGRIACAQLDLEGRASGLTAALEMPAHMSYPYLLEHDGEIYCIPETAEAREVALYKARELPTQWTRVGTLLADVAACDSTVFAYEGRWWLLHTDAEEDPNLKLYAWHAPSLFGPWQPHANNPIKTDIRSARPAGTPFFHEGHLYRPAQDASVRYGGRLRLQRILRLTPTEFREETAAIIAPYAGSPYSQGMHTLAAAGPITLVDGACYRFNKTAFLAALRRAAARLLRAQP